MKYRIVKCNAGYRIQRRFLGLFWKQYAEHGILADSKTLDISVCPYKRAVLYQTLDVAKHALQNIVLTRHAYRGHRIAYSSLHNIFVDLSGTYIGPFNSYKAVCDYIDEQYAKKYAEKHKNDIVSVCVLHDTYTNKTIEL